VTSGLPYPTQYASCTLVYEAGNQILCLHRLPDPPDGMLELVPSAVLPPWGADQAGQDEDPVLISRAQISAFAQKLRAVAKRGLERVMNLGENRIGMRILRLARSPAVPRFPHS
jgi:hypothetical protein